METSTRKWFFEQLKSLRKNTGLLQYEHMLQSDNPEAEINDMLDRLMTIRNEFAILPENTFRRLVQKGIMETDNLRGLYPADVHKWVSKHWQSLDSSTHQKMVSDYNRKNAPEEIEPQEEGRELTHEETMSWIRKFKDMVLSSPMAKTRAGKWEGRYGTLREDYKPSEKPPQVLVNCDKCENLEPERSMCPKCMGHGKIKKFVGGI